MAAGAPQRTNEGSLIGNLPVCRPSDAYHWVSLLDWGRPVSTEPEKKSLKLLFEIKSDKTKSLGNKVYK